jgi:hypothetical protein
MLLPAKGSFEKFDFSHLFKSEMNALLLCWVSFSPMQSWLQFLIQGYTEVVFSSSRLNGNTFQFMNGYQLRNFGFRSLVGKY